MAERQELFVRSIKNPILTRDSLPYAASAVLNPGAALQGADTVLLMRVEDRRGISHLTVARSKNGVDDWDVEGRPLMSPAVEEYPQEAWGVEDPRIVYLEEVEHWAITYTAYSAEGPQVALALTSDFEVVERFGPILAPEDKDAALFPCRFKDRWAILHRPTGRPQYPGGNIWISFSEDLRHWKDTTIVMEARQGPWWDADKIGLSTPPLCTEEGWLVAYHGVKETCFGAIYRVGLALLALDDPTKVVRRSSEWVMAPSESYERTGDVGNVVFPCGWIEQTGRLRMYYGCADTRIGMAEGSVAEILEWLREQDGKEGDVS